MKSFVNDEQHVDETLNSVISRFSFPFINWEGWWGGVVGLFFGLSYIKTVSPSLLQN